MKIPIIIYITHTYTLPSCGICIVVVSFYVNFIRMLRAVVCISSFYWFLFLLFSVQNLYNFCSFVPLLCTITNIGITTRLSMNVRPIVRSTGHSASIHPTSVGQHSSDHFISICLPANSIQLKSFINNFDFYLIIE